jgi:catechol 2,3-dioxygenase-like lactoylglutathione lyase family enzyme
MLDHVTIGVRDVGRSKEFYDRALRPLGITRLYAEGIGSPAMACSPKLSSGSEGVKLPRPAHT